jgi:ABC-2 type transport system permease protein
MDAVRIALLTIRLVMRTKVALFFTFLFPVVFLFIYAGLFAHGNPEAVVYMFGPVVTLNIMGSGFWGLGMQSVVQRERGSLRRYRLAPIGPGTIVLSNLLANYLLGLPTIGLLVFCAMTFFHMPLKISLFTLLVLVTVGTFAFAGFGLTIASVANTMQEAQIYNNVLWLTLLFLSGVTVPLPLLPHWIQRLAAFLPATYLVVAFQAVMVQGQPLVDHWPEMLVLLVSGTFGLLFAWKLFRWEKEEKISRRGKLLSLVFIIPFLVMGVWMNARGDLTVSWAMSYSMMGRGAARSDQAADTENLILSFENPQAQEMLLKDWQVATDASSSGHSMAELSLVSPGAVDTQHAMQIKGRLAPGPGTEKGFVAARYRLSVPAGRKKLHGIEFWVRGDSRLYQINFQPPASPSGPSPSSSPLPPLLPSVSLVPTSDWQSVRIPVGWLENPSTAKSAAGTWLLEIIVSGPPGQFSIEVDQIGFY